MDSPRADAALELLLEELRQLRDEVRELKGPHRPSNVGLHDVLSVPEAARWVRVDETRLRKLLTEAGAIHTGLGPARVVASDVLAVLKGEETTATPPPTKMRKGRKGRSVSAVQPLPRRRLD